MLDEGDKMLDDGFEEEVVLIAAEDRVLTGCGSCGWAWEGNAVLMNRPRLLYVEDVDVMLMHIAVIDV